MIVRDVIMFVVSSMSFFMGFFLEWCCGVWWDDYCWVGVVL